MSTWTLAESADNHLLAPCRGKEDFVLLPILNCHGLDVGHAIALAIDWHPLVGRSRRRRAGIHRSRGPALRCDDLPDVGTGSSRLNRHHPCRNRRRDLSAHPEGIPPGFRRDRRAVGRRPSGPGTLASPYRIAPNLQSVPSSWSSPRPSTFAARSGSPRSGCWSTTPSRTPPPGPSVLAEGQPRASFRSSVWRDA
jgi:hypothetical protein